MLSFLLSGDCTTVCLSDGLLSTFWTGWLKGELTIKSTPVETLLLNTSTVEKLTHMIYDFKKSYIQGCFHFYILTSDWLTDCQVPDHDWVIDRRTYYRINSSSHIILAVWGCHYCWTPLSIFRDASISVNSSNGNSEDTVCISIVSTVVKFSSTIPSRKNKYWSSPLSALIINKKERKKRAFSRLKTKKQSDKT